jgi:hypothetical protein
MPRKTLYIICMISLLGFAVSLTFVPDFFWSLFGTGAGPHAIWIGRYMTAVMLGNVYMLWQLKDFERGAHAAKYFSQAQIVEWGLVGLYVGIYTLQGGYSAMGWGMAVLSLIFAILFGIDGFKD